MKPRLFIPDYQSVQSFYTRAVACYLEMRVKTIAWVTACHLDRSAVGHCHSNHQAGGCPWKPQDQSLPLPHGGP